MKNIILIGLLIFTSCTTPEMKFNSFVSQGYCQEGIDYIKQSKRKKILHHSSTVAGDISSYVLTGLGYGADVILITAGGVAVMGVVCSPAIAIDVAAETDGRLTLECFEHSADILNSYAGGIDKAYSSIGKKAYENTASWRCPAKSKLNSFLIEASRCYVEQGTTESINKAREQIKSLKVNEVFANCLSESDKKELKYLEEMIEDKVVL